MWAHTFIIVLHNNQYLYATHGNILSMENKHKKLFVIQAVKKALIMVALCNRADQYIFAL